MRPFISISTPCLNSVNTIERTIRSVLEQDFKDYEYIIVDGGSTDGTLDIIKKYEPLFEGRMRWSCEPDKGIYDAFNKGAKSAKGFYCWNVNADDWIEKNALTVIYSYLKDDYTRDSILVGEMRHIDEKSNKVISVFTVSPQDIKNAYKKDGMIPHPATIVAKKIYEEYGYYDIRFKIAGDMDWFHRVYPYEVKFICCNHILTNFTNGGVSSSLSYKKEYRDRKLFFTKKYKNKILVLIHLILWHKLFFINIKERLAGKS